MSTIFIPLVFIASACTFMEPTLRRIAAALEERNRLERKWWDEEHK
jgi:hypothetical protein